MSKFRTLLPGADSSVAVGLIPKLEKALILCELLRSSSSNMIREIDDNVFFLHEYFPGISIEGKPLGSDNKNAHFKVYNNRSN